MIRNLETESLVFGDDDEFSQKLDAFNRFCMERIWMISGTILSFPHEVWSFLKYLAMSITDFFLRKYMAIIIFALSASIFSACIVVLSGDKRIITASYCSVFNISSVICIIFERGKVTIVLESSKEQSEQQKLITDFKHRKGQEADQPAGYGVKDKSQAFQSSLENILEPRQESAAGPSNALQNFPSAENFAGPSSAPKWDYIAITSISDDSYGSNKTSPSAFVARLHPDAINFFGPPLQVFGADSYRVLYSSDEEYAFKEPVKAIKVPYDHHTHSNRSLNSRNDCSISHELTAVANANGVIGVSFRFIL